MKLGLTMFLSKFDNKTEKKMRFDSFDDLVRLLKALYKQSALKPRADEPVIKGVHAPLICPAIYERGTTRSKDNVIKWAGWAMLDVDDGSRLSQFKELPYRMVIYNTASSKEDHPKFRVVVPLTRSVSREEFPEFWYAFNKEFGEHGDPQTKDISRMYYIPGQYPNAYNFFIDQPGEYINPDDLMDKYPMPRVKKSGLFANLPSQAKANLLRYRASLMEENLSEDFDWTSYKDCPFVNHELITEYEMLSDGWYHKMYQIMVSIASIALKKDYPISVEEIIELVKEIDADTGNWYPNRPWAKEAKNALEFAMGAN